MIYLDHAATTPVDKRVFAAMEPYFTEEFGNPSALYTLGRKARQAVDQARETMARLMNTSSRKVIFTSGGTESCNLALFGVVEALALPTKHIIVSAIEHSAVLAVAQKLENKGVEVTYLEVEADGLVDAAKLETAIKENTVLVSIGYANNEIGVIQDMVSLGNICRDKGVVFHTDACQITPFIEFDLAKLPVDLVSINGSKMYGPKGVGALIMGSKDVDLAAQMVGGGQEFELRSGTENVPEIVGLAKAYELVCEEREETVNRLVEWRDLLIKGLTEETEDVQLIGSKEKRLPNHVSVIVGGVEGESLLIRLDQEGICVSTGAACSSGSLEPSHVLKAIGLKDKDGYSALRLTLGKLNTGEQVEQALVKIKQVIVDLRNIAF